MTRKRGISVEKAKKIREAKEISDTKLARMRVKKGFSQDSLSAVTGVPKRTIQCYEQQTRPIDGARLDTLCDLCFALDCKIEDIIESKDLIEKYRITK